MENKQQQPENQTSTQVTTHTELLIHPTRAITFKDHGFMTAGKNNGDPISFENQLRWISEGHKVEGVLDGGQEQLQKQLLENNINGKEIDLSNLKNEQAHIQEVVIGDKETQISNHKAEIAGKRIKCEEGKIVSNFNWFRCIFYGILTSILFIYLIFFYASAINAAFFRDMGEVITGSSTSDISMLMGSIFDAKGIFRSSPNLLFTYLGSVIFLSLGLIPHIFKGSSFYAIKAGSVILLCLLIDGLLAYKIDSGIHDMKTMMGIGDPSWIWYKSINFYLVIVFGFVAYILFGIMYEVVMKEWSKRNINAVVELEIKNLKSIIRSLEKEIILHKVELKDLKKQVDELVLLIKNLTKELEKVLTRPETLKRNMENFYAGWLHYLNGSESLEARKFECDRIYQRFNQPASQYAYNPN